MRRFCFQAKLWLPRPKEHIFEFFSDARNLEQLTPPWLQFRIVTPGPIQMQPGTEIDYRIKIRGIPSSWRSRITIWDPPHRFVDEQVRGPYRMWVHEHRFAEDSGGTACEDRVEYAPPGGTLIDKLFVRRDIRKIFEYRSQRLHQLFGEDAAA
jgi:ligand-binding SRPBCC domain-containing protein